MDPILSYIRDGQLPSDSLEAKKVRVKAARFTVLNGELYKKGFSIPYLKCLTPEEARYVLREIHEGVCGNHSRPQSLVGKTVRAGYFWPTMQKDAVELLKKCDKCQWFKNVQHIPGELLTSISSPWPSFTWGIDIVGPLPRGKKQVKFLLIAIDYFTKWVEAEPLAVITEGKIQTFIWKNILIKARLEEAKGAWPEDLPGAGVLWAYRTTARIPTGETPFKLAFGTEAIILAKVGVSSLRQAHYDKGTNNDEMRLNLDCLVEVKDEAALRMAWYQQKKQKYHNQRVKLKRFNPDDMMLRKVSQTTRDPRQGKLGPTWEGSYKIIRFSKRGSYYLKDLDGKPLPRPWNVKHLKKYYQ
ncbi:uncharacterized protein LOC142606101 [Castanea sativa]|uniref:uncharacterized protein LOC142606101 n=1 Tax=Castanea sativa TaxID=21020 RepID=UPI003F64C079